MDYSSALYIPFRKGEVAIFENYIYLVHTVNLADFEILATDIEKQKRLFSNLDMVASLDADLNEINKLISALQLHRRNSRSIDFIGSTLKFIAGTPDHDDFVILSERQSKLISAENQQVEINTQFMEKINELTSQINTLSRNYYTKIDDTSSPDLFELITIRNQRAITLLNNIVYSVTFARLNIVNPIILTDIELSKIIELESPYNVNDLLLASEVKVYSSKNILKYLIKVPNVKEQCPLLKIYPVVHKNVILDLRNNHVSLCKFRNSPLKNCKRSLETTYCQKDESDECLKQIMNNSSATCQTTTAHQVEPIEQVDENTIVINDQAVTINEDGHNVTVKGT